MKLPTQAQRAALREALHDELSTIQEMNELLRQTNVHDGQRAEAQKARGIALAEVRHLLEILTTRPSTAARVQAISKS